ncbi:hypothetical protein Q5752_004595 [Cryptotrichosporon argae]
MFIFTTASTKLNTTLSASFAAASLTVSLGLLATAHACLHRVGARLLLWAAAPEAVYSTTYLAAPRGASDLHIARTGGIHSRATYALYCLSIFL